MAELPRPPGGPWHHIREWVAWGPPSQGSVQKCASNNPPSPGRQVRTYKRQVQWPGPAWTGQWGRQGGRSMASESQPGQHSMARSPSSRKIQASRQPVAVDGLG